MDEVVEVKPRWLAWKLKGNRHLKMENKQPTANLLLAKLRRPIEADTTGGHPG
jgi:hypothetical protein